MIASRAVLFALSALALGALHSFAPDHLAAVGVFVSRRPSWRRAMSLGARWGLGHSLTVVLLGSALAISGLRLPERFAPSAERAVGVTLILIGLISLVRALGAHLHVHAHPDGTRHLHWHRHQPELVASESSDAHCAHVHEHDHGHGALLGIGMLHGLAGTGALVVALPSAVGASRTQAVIFLLCFGLGTIASMTLAGALAGHALRLASRRFSPALTLATAAAALSSVAIGVWWVLSGGA